VYHHFAVGSKAPERLRENMTNTQSITKQRAPRNRTLVLSDEERNVYRKQLLRLPLEGVSLQNRIICGDILDVCAELPQSLADLLILDPPYNLTKTFGGEIFRETTTSKYEEWFEERLVKILPLLKKSATLYVCGDWKSSAALHRVLERHVVVRNRITWEREKGRGAKANWKNASEDIWFCTVSDDYFFDVEAVKLKRKVIAPYRQEGAPKDWEETEEGGFRLTHPSNLWTDLTVPFWSMPENTDHPTQKPEKLIAKLILASSRPGDLVVDPFLGSGTTAVVSKKLNRHFVGIELDELYSCMSLARVAAADKDREIQGYQGGVFWERNSLNLQDKDVKSASAELSLFGHTPS
jgi:site-specific DNA-methyltransferase (adenine-specific)